MMLKEMHKKPFEYFQAPIHMVSKVGDLPLLRYLILLSESTYSKSKLVVLILLIPIINDFCLKAFMKLVDTYLKKKCHFLH